MNLLSPVSSIMTKELITLNPDDALQKVKDIFESERIHHIPIVEDSKLSGLVSKSDYLFFCRTIDGKNVDRRLEKFRLSNYQVSDIMTKGIATLSPDDKINVALEIFKENIFHSIPVIDNNKVVGIVTPYDIIRTLSEDKQATNTYQS